jgi:hypothetical protein
MSILGVCKFTEPIFFGRGRHGQESEEGKEDRESYQEGGKEDVKTKEVVVSATRNCGSGSKPGRQTNLFKDLKGPQQTGIEKRQGKIGPLCRRRLLHKGPVFC